MMMKTTPEAHSSTREAAERHVHAQIRSRPEVPDAEPRRGEDDPMNTNYHLRRGQDVLSLGAHAALTDLVEQHPAVLASVQYQQSREQHNRVMEILNEIRENTGGHVPRMLAQARDKQKKKAEQHFKHGELKGLIMRFEREGGGEAHMVVDGSWKMLEGDEDEPDITVSGDVVELLPAADEAEEPSLWRRVVPGEHRDSEPFCAENVLGEMHRERSHVGRILALPPPAKGHMVVDKVRAAHEILAEGQRVTTARAEDGTAGWVREEGGEHQLSDVPLKEEHLLPASDAVLGEDATRAGRRAGQVVRLACSAPEKKEWPSWLQATPRPWGVVRGANNKKPAEHLVEFAVRGTRISSEEPADEIEIVTLSLPTQFLERARAGERSTDIIEAWPRPSPQRRVQFSHVLLSATGAQVRKDFRGIVKRYESHVSKGERVELSLGEAPGAETIWCRRDRPSEFSFSHLILDRDEVGSYNDPALVQQLVAWHQQGGAKKKAAKPREEPLPEDVPVVLAVKLDGRSPKKEHELVATVTATSAKGSVLLRLPFDGDEEQLQLPRSSVSFLRQLDPAHGRTNEEALRRLVRLEQFRDGQHLRLRLKLPKKLGDDGVEVVCKVLSGCADEHWRLCLPGSHGTQLVVVAERSARSYDYLGAAGPTDCNADECLDALAKVFLTPKATGKAPLCAETRTFKLELPLNRKLGDANAPAYERAEELLSLCCQYGHLAHDVEPSDKDLDLVFPFPNGQQRLHRVPRDFLQRVLFFDRAGEACNAHCWPRVGDAVRVLRGPHTGADGFVLRVSPGDLKLVVQLKAAAGGLAEVEVPGEDLWVHTRSAEDRSSMAAAMGVPLPSDAPMGAPPAASAPPAAEQPSKKKRSSSKAARSGEDREEGQAKRRKATRGADASGSAAPKRKQRAPPPAAEDLDPSDEE